MPNSTEKTQDGPHHETSATSKYDVTANPLSSPLDFYPCTKRFRFHVNSNRLYTNVDRRVNSSAFSVLALRQKVVPSVKEGSGVTAIYIIATRLFARNQSHMVAVYEGTNGGFTNIATRVIDGNWCQCSDSDLRSNSKTKKLPLRGKVIFLDF